MANKIKNKYSAPRATEFTPKDLVVDVKNGRLYYKSNYAVYEIRGTLFSTFTDVIDEGAVGSSLTTEVIFNSNGLFDGLSDFTISDVQEDGTGTVNIGTAVIGNATISSGTLTGITSFSVANDIDIGDNQLTVQNLVVDGLTSNKVVFTKAGGELAIDNNFKFTIVDDSPSVATGINYTPASNVTELEVGRIKLNNDTDQSVTPSIGELFIGKEISNNTNASPLSIRNADGFVRIGPRSEGFGHLITSNDAFYMNKPVQIRGSNGTIISGDGFHISSHKSSGEDDRKADLLLTTNGANYNDATKGGRIRLIHQTDGDNSEGSGIQMRGNVKIFGDQAGNQLGTMRATHDVVAFASDKRLKENIIKISNPLDKINKLRGVYFDWNKKSEEEGFRVERKQNEIGMIAQEVEKVIPQAIDIAPFDEYKGTERENYKTIKYDRIIPLLVECIKEQQKQINKLQKQINEK